jgi:RNA binding exosome subunit
MTCKEKLHQLIEALPEHDAERLLEQFDENNTLNGSSSPEVATDVASLFAFFKEIADNAPEEDARRVPTDLAENLDHYIYGTAKRIPKS